MAQPENQAAKTLAEILRAPDGVAQKCAELIAAEGLYMAPISADAVVEQYVAADLAEKASSVRYPMLHVYCERLINKLREKFRTFSGTATLAVDVRTSHEHLESIGQQLQLYVASVTEVLQQKRGSWGDGTFYTGGYEVIYSPVKRGGKNYLQSAVVRLEVHITTN
jgi:hypothetical protein